MRGGTHVVITTIGDGQILLDLAENARRYKRTVTVWVIADRKTPTACRRNATRASDGDVEVRYLSPKDQDFLMRPFADFYKRLPWDSDSRRNIGYLLAYQAGCERLVLLDDDNYPLDDEDFIGEHERVGEPYAIMANVDDSGYYNYLAGHAMWPRGYPYSARIGPAGRSIAAIGTIGANLGVWTRDPDLDAVGWLGGIAPIERWRGLPVYLAHGTWTPINSQNTCLHRELVPAAMYVVQRYPGVEIMERYGDIFAGYFLQAVMGEGCLVRIGSPLVEHRRNSHNHLADLCQEAPAIAILEWLLPKLRSFRPDRAAVVAVRYLQLADYLRRLSREKLPGSLPSQSGDWLSETSFTMELYAKACLEINRQSREKLPGILA